MLQRLPKGPARKRAAKLIKESKWFQKQMQKAGMSKKNVQTDAMPKTTKETARRLLDLLQRLPKGPARKRASKLIKESKWFQKQMQKFGMSQKSEMLQTREETKIKKMKQLLKMFQRLPKSARQAALKKIKDKPRFRQLLAGMLQAMQKKTETAEKEAEDTDSSIDDASFLQRLRARAPVKGDETSLQKESFQTGAMPKTTKKQQ